MTKQELQRMIWHVGFEPPLWEFDGVLYPENDGEYNSSTPHYPCEWLWDTLRKTGIPIAVTNKKGYAQIYSEDSSVNILVEHKDLHFGLLEFMVILMDRGWEDWGGLIIRTV